MLVLRIDEMQWVKWNAIKNNPENARVKMAPFKEENAITDPTFVALLAKQFPFEVENGKIHYNNPANYAIFNKTLRLNIEFQTGDTPLTSIEGVGYFESLKYLFCSRHHLSAIDLSLIPNLRTLRCHSNRLASLDISMLVRFSDLLCGSPYESNGWTSKILALTLRADQVDFWLTENSNPYNGPVQTIVLP